jgi:hypothetical protein
MDERISGAEDSIENISTTIKENAKWKKIKKHIKAGLSELHQTFQQRL